MSVQDSTFKTTHVMDNEIIKANDFEFAFEQLVENVSKATQMLLESDQDFVINGKVLWVSDMNVRVSPIYGVCKHNGKPFGRTETTDETITFAGSESGRIDILEVQGAWETYDEQQRAFNDPDTDTQTYQYVDTKKLMKPVYRIKQGVEGAGVAPDVDEDWVKLAEVVIPAGVTTLSQSAIKNITADVAGEDNEDWTNEENITYNIGYISDVNERFRVQHNADGTHKNRVINQDSLDIGTGTKQINGNILPIGGSVSIPNESIAASDPILSVVTKAAAMITTLYNSYLKFNGAYKFNGDLSISAIADPDTKVLTKPLTLHANGDGTAVVKVDGNTMLTINADGRLTTNGQAASGNNDIVTKAVTDAISNSLSSLSTRVYNLEQSVSQQSPNKVLSTGKAATDHLAFDGQFNVSPINILVATTENIVLDGTETSAVDGVSLSNDDLILVKNQTDETENGVYKFVSNSGWDRATDFNTPEKLKGQILKIADGTINKGKMFYMINEVVPESYGTASVFIAEYFGSIKPLANKLIMRDEYGRAQVAAPVNACDIARKYEIDSLYGNVMPSLAGEAAVGTCTTFARSDHVHPATDQMANSWVGFADIFKANTCSLPECFKGRLIDHLSDKYYTLPKCTLPPMTSEKFWTSCLTACASCCGRVCINITDSFISNCWNCSGYDYCCSPYNCSGNLIWISGQCHVGMLLAPIAYLESNLCSTSSSGIFCLWSKNCICNNTQFTLYAKTCQVCFDSCGKIISQCQRKWYNWITPGTCVDIGCCFCAYGCRGICTYTCLYYMLVDWPSGYPIESKVANCFPNWVCCVGYEPGPFSHEGRIYGRAISCNTQVN